MTTVTINSVTTADAAPTAAPHKISNRSGKSTATVRFVVNGTGAVRAWFARLGGVGPSTGVKVGGEGAVCGLAKCGVDKLLARPLGVEIVEAVTYGEASPNADGGYTVNVYAYTDDGGV